MRTDIKNTPFMNRKRISGVLIYAVLLLLLAVCELISPGFLDLKHLDNVLRQAAFLGIAAIGQTLVILAAGIDLTVASIITLSNIVSAQVMDGQNANAFTALLIVLSAGMIIGFVNGAGIQFLRIAPLVMTLGMGSIVKGFAYIYSSGAPKGAAAPIVKYLCTGKLFGFISIPLLIWVVLSAGTVVILRFTVLGRSVYMLGTNPVASKYSGIHYKGITVALYVISTAMASFVGFLIVGYTGTGYLDTGNDYTMNSIAAVVIGGTAVTGGIGGYGGTFAGAIIMTVIVALLTVVKIPASGKQIIQGILILSILFAYGRNKKGN